MSLRRWLGWLLAVALTASLSGRAGAFQAESPRDRSAPQDGPVSTCAWPDENAQRVLARGLGAVAAHDETVSSVATRLQEAHGVPLSFIESDEDARISFDMSATTVQGVLEQMVERAPVYRYATIAGRLVLYPRSTKWDARLEAVRLGPGPRRKVASELTHEFERRLPAFAKFGAIHQGNANSYVFQDEVSVVGSGSVVELLVQLLGARPSAVFSIEKVPSFVSPQLFLGGVRHWQAMKMTSPAKVMRPGEKVQLTVTGIFPDGTHKDVTAGQCLTLYWVSNEKVVSVSADGLVTGQGIGEAWVQAKNADQVSTLSLQVATSAPGTSGAGSTRDAPR